MTRSIPVIMGACGKSELFVVKHGRHISSECITSTQAHNTGKHPRVLRYSRSAMTNRGYRLPVQA